MSVLEVNREPGVGGTVMAALIARGVVFFGTVTPDTGESVFLKVHGGLAELASPFRCWNTNLHELAVANYRPAERAVLEVK